MFVWLQHGDMSHGAVRVAARTLLDGRHWRFTARDSAYPCTRPLSMRLNRCVFSLRGKGLGTPIGDVATRVVCMRMLRLPGNLARE